MGKIIFPNLGIELEGLSKGITVFGISIAFYGIIIALAMIAALFIVFREVKKSGQSEDEYMDIYILAIFFGIIGARLYYVIFNWKEYKDDIVSVFYLRNGGLAIYGGIILAALAVIIYCKVKKADIITVVDTGVQGLVLAQAIGRWGNFFNREAFGGYCDNLFAMQVDVRDVAISVVNKMSDTIIEIDGHEYLQVHPTFLYESAGCLAIFIILKILNRKKLFKGEIAAGYMIGYGILRFFIEGMRTDQLLLFNSDIPVSRLVSLVLIIFGTFIFIYNMCKKKTEQSV